MEKPSTWPKQRKAFRDNYLAAIIAVAALLLSLSTAAQTLDTSRVRQGVFANPGYDYIGLGASRTLLLPRDTFPQAARDSGAISIKNGTIYRWTGNHHVPTGGTDNSIATGSRTATGDFTQNWNRKQLIFDTTKDVRIYSNAPDWNFTNNKQTFLFEHYNSVVGPKPLSLKWSLKDVTNSFDSVGGGIISDLYSTTINHYTGSQSGNLYLNEGGAQLAAYGTHASTITAYEGTITLDAADSIQAKLTPAASADSILGIRSFSFGLNTLVKVPASAIGGGLQQVTSRGNKTKDTAIIAANRTPRLLPDTLSEPDFEFTVFPDIQGMTYTWEDQLKSMFDWVIANKSSKNIKALLTLGDLTEQCQTYEWVRLDSMFDRIDSLQLPYSIVCGNHDIDGGGSTNPARPTTQINSYFGVSRFASSPYFGHAYHDSIENNYIKLDVGSMKLLVVSLEFLPRNDILDWAGRVIDSFPDRKVIISTHAYITTHGERSADTSRYSVNEYGFDVTSNSGQAMWDKLIKKKKNIFLVLNGHFVNTSEENRGYSRRLTDVGENGNIIHQVFVNYQRAGNATYVAPYSDAGLGYFMRMRFSPSTGKIYTSYYSDFLHQYDPAMDSFSLFSPGIEIQNSVTVQGGLYVQKAARFDDTVTIKSVAKYTIPFSGQDNKLTGDSRLFYKNAIVNAPALVLNNGNGNFITYFGSDKMVKPTSNVYYDSANARLGIGTTTPQRFFDVRGTAGTVFGATSVGGYPPSFRSGVGSSFKFVHGGSDYGLSLSRSQSGTLRGATFLFFNTNHNTPDSLNAITAGQDIGRIAYQAANTSKGIVPAGDFIYQAINVNSSVVGGQYLWGCGGSTSEFFNDLSQIKMMLSFDGNLQISSNPSNTGYKLWVNGTVAANKDSTPAITSIGSEKILVQDQTTGQFKNIAAANVNIGLAGSATLDFPSTSAQTSSDLTITVTGAAAGDLVVLGVDNASVAANSSYTAWVSASNTVTVRFNNYSTGAIDPASGTFKARILK